MSLSISVLLCIIYAFSLLVNRLNYAYLTIISESRDIDGVFVLGKSLEVYGGEYRMICWIRDNVKVNETFRTNLREIGWDLYDESDEGIEVLDVDVVLLLDPFAVIVGDVSEMFEEIEESKIYLNYERRRSDGKKLRTFGRDVVLFSGRELVTSILWNDLTLHEVYEVVTSRNVEIIEFPFGYNIRSWMKEEYPIVWNTVISSIGVKIIAFDSEEIYSNKTDVLLQWWIDLRALKHVLSEETLSLEQHTNDELPLQAERVGLSIINNRWSFQNDRFIGFTETRLKIYDHGTKFFNKLFEDLENAENSIHIITYGFIYGEIPKRIVDLLIMKRRSGLSVKIVVSRYGSYVDGACKDWWEWIVDNNIDVTTNDGIPFSFATIFDYDGVLGGNRWYDPSGDELFHPEHRKIIVIDGKYAYVGGVGLEDHFLNATDIMVRFEESGIVYDIQETFLTSFGRLGGFVRMDIFNLDKYFPPFSIEERNLMKIKLIHQSINIQDHIVTTYLNEIKMAEEEVFLVMSEFADLKILKKLCETSKRGVSVVVVLPANSRNCVKYVQEATYESMVECGINLYEYFGSELHAKLMVVDRRRIFVGSANLNGPGLYANLEANVLIEDKSEANKLRDTFLQAISDPEASKRISKVDLGVLKKVRNNILWYLDYFFHIELPCGIGSYQDCQNFVYKNGVVTELGGKTGNNFV